MVQALPAFGAPCGAQRRLPRPFKRLTAAPLLPRHSQVCSLPCVTSDPACKPLRALQLRLADAVLADPRYFKVPPPGTVVTGCGPRGPGLLLNATQLQALSTFEPAKVGGVTDMQPVCRLPAATVRNPARVQRSPNLHPRPACCAPCTCAGAQVPGVLHTYVPRGWIGGAADPA